jgi:ABC-2 type transport system ATP-binding protein
MQDDGFYILALKGYSQIEDVLAALRLAKACILEMEILQPDLEEVFVNITRPGTADSPAFAP